MVALPRIAAVVLLASGGLVAAAWGRGAWTAAATWDVPRTLLAFGDRPERGEHLVRVLLACGQCHGDDLAGAWVPHEGGSFWAPNLTTLGEVSRLDGDYSAADYDGAIRAGIDVAGHGLWLHPVNRYGVLRQRDLADVAAWLSQLEPIERANHESRPGWQLKLGLGLGGDGLDVAAGLRPEPAPDDLARAPDAVFGAYLASLAGCVACHGGQPPRPATGAAFAAGLLGACAGGRFGGLADLELDALWTWSRTISGSDAP